MSFRFSSEKHKGKISVLCSAILPGKLNIGQKFMVSLEKLCKCDSQTSVDVHLPSPSVERLHECEPVTVPHGLETTPQVTYDKPKVELIEHSPDHGEKMADPTDFHDPSPLPNPSPLPKFVGEVFNAALRVVTSSSGLIFLGGSATLATTTAIGIVTNTLFYGSMGDPPFGGGSFTDFITYQHQLEKKLKMQLRSLIGNVDKTLLGDCFSREGRHRYVTPRKNRLYFVIHDREGLKVGQIGKCSHILSGGKLVVQFNDIASLRKKGHSVKTPMLVNLVKKDVQEMAVYTDFLAISKVHERELLQSFPILKQL